jgi:hypothetical protein
MMVREIFGLTIRLIGCEPANVCDRPAPVGRKFAARPAEKTNED